MITVHIVAVFSAFFAAVGRFSTISSALYLSLWTSKLVLNLRVGLGIYMAPTVRPNSPLPLITKRHFSTGGIGVQGQPLASLLGVSQRSRGHLSK